MTLEPLHDAHERKRARGLIAVNAAYGHQHRPRVSMRDSADDASSWKRCRQSNLSICQGVVLTRASSFSQSQGTRRNAMSTK